MSAPLSESIAIYCADTKTLEALPTSTETTFYPDIRTLLTAVLKHEKLPFDVRTGTSEKGTASHDMPDFVLGDGALFVGVYGEVKRASTTCTIWQPRPSRRIRSGDISPRPASSSFAMFEGSACLSAIRVTSGTA